MNLVHANHEFGAVINSESKILILGSFPSVKSRHLGFFYMHPQNRFWKILSELFSDNFLVQDIDKKSNLLHHFGIALYDVIENCDISGSKDASITNVIPADIQAMISASKITKIYLNGKIAFSLFNKHNKELSCIAHYLPSSSPANATYTLDKLIEAWKIILD